MRAVAQVRAKIVAFAAGSGEARDMILNGEADVWFSWHDWWGGNQEGFSAVAVGREHAIARDLSLVPFLNTSYLPPCDVEQAIDYIEFVRESAVANLEMELAGWFKEDVFERSTAGLAAGSVESSVERSIAGPTAGSEAVKGGKGPFPCTAYFGKDVRHSYTVYTCRR